MNAAEVANGIHTKIFLTDGYVLMTKANIVLIGQNIVITANNMSQDTKSAPSES